MVLLLKVRFDSVRRYKTRVRMIHYLLELYRLEYILEIIQFDDMIQLILSY